MAKKTPADAAAEPEEQAPETPAEAPEVSDDADVQPEEDLAAEDDTEASTGLQDEVVLGEALTEESPELSDPRAAEREEWIAANPDASVIPPSLLPPDFQDGTIITPGLP